MGLLDRKRLASPGMCVFLQYEWLMTFVTLQTQWSTGQCHHSSKLQCIWHCHGHKTM